MTKKHREDSCSTTAARNSSKIIALEQDRIEEHSVCKISEFDGKYPLQFSSSQEKYVDVEEIKSSGEYLQEDFEDRMVSPPLHSYDTTIDTLYAQLSKDFANLKTCDQQTLRQKDEDCYSNSETESSGTSSEGSIIWSSDDEVVDEDSDDNQEDCPIFDGANVTYEEHLMAVMSLAARHNLNQEQLSDLIEVIKLHCPSGGSCVGSGKALYKEVAGEVKMKFHNVCENCFGLYPEDVSVYRCSTTGRSG